MKKKLGKKLKLNRETLKRLEEEQIEPVAGANTQKTVICGSCSCTTACFPCTP